MINYLTYEKKLTHVYTDKNRYLWQSVILNDKLNWGVKTKQFTNVNLDSDQYGSFRSLTKVEGVGNFPFGQLTE